MEEIEKVEKDEQMSEIEESSMASVAEMKEETIVPPIESENVAPSIDENNVELEISAEKIQSECEPLVQKELPKEEVPVIEETANTASEENQSAAGAINSVEPGFVSQPSIQQPYRQQMPQQATFGQTTQTYYSQQRVPMQQTTARAYVQSTSRPAAVKKTKKKKNGMSAIGVIAIALACAILGGLIGGIICKPSSKEPVVGTDPALLARIEALEKSSKKAAQQQSYDAKPTGAATEVYEQNVDSVVGITTGATTTNVFGQVTNIASSGSGFIVRGDGYVVTNYHVIDGGQTLSVKLRDGMEYPAQVVGYDSSMDVALLKIEANDLQAANVGDSDLLRVGDQVAAIGNPLGELTLSMTVGYISALDREINPDGVPINMLQTDVAINSGNSGGPLFDMKGNVIGITTAKYSGATNSGASIEGIGFALPINDVMSIVDDLLELGYITGRAYLGITAMDMDAQTASVYSLPVGAYVSSVVDGFCAQKAGLQTGDIILSLGEYEISCYADLSKALRKFAPGETTTMDIFRAGAKMTLEITFDERPSDEEINRQSEMGQGQQSTDQPTPDSIPEQQPQEQPNQDSGIYGFSPFDDSSMEDLFRYFFGG